MGPNAATGPHLLPLTVQYDTVLQDIKAPLQCIEEWQCAPSNSFTVLLLG